MGKKIGHCKVDAAMCFYLNFDGNEALHYECCTFFYYYYLMQIALDALQTAHSQKSIHCGIITCSLGRMFVHVLKARGNDNYNIISCEFMRLHGGGSDCYLISPNL